VGKTHVASLIVRQLRAEGRNVAAFKPACSGAAFDAAGCAHWDDLDRLRAALGTEVVDDELCPQRFLAPLTPPLAAKLEHRTVDVAAINAGLLRCGRRSDGVIIEGAGGWLCPLTEGTTFADWVAAWGFPVLIVARPGLGTINHTLLTVEAIRSRRLSVAGIVFNETSASACDHSTATNAAEIEARSGVPVLGQVAFGAGSELLHGQRAVRIRWHTLMKDVSGPSSVVSGNDGTRVILPN